MKYCLFFLASLMSLFIGCSDDWLKPDPLSFYTPEDIFVDKDGYESALVRCKKEMNSENHGYPPNTHYLYGEFSYSDLAVSLEQSDFTKNTPNTNFKAPILSLFKNAFAYIKNANTVISRIDDIKWDNPKERDRILSEAFWFRAYWYYRLVNTYGDIPWLGNELKGPKLDYRTTSRWAILGKIQKDLEFAVEKLPEIPRKPGDITKGAANHLLTKVYLANALFDKAVSSATAVINGPYALMTGRFGSDASNNYRNVIWDLHRCENKSLPQNKETIYTTIDRPDAPPSTWWDSRGTCSMRLYVPSYWSVLDDAGNRATNWQTPSGDSLGIGNADVRPNHFYNYSIWNEKEYKWNNTPDMRRAGCNWIEMGDSISEIITVRKGSPNFGEPLTKKNYKSLSDTINSWFSWPYHKIFVPTPNFNEPYGGQGDWYIFRLAETYLLRAEAHFHQGQIDLAKADINKVRERSKAPLITVGDVSLDYIFDERARELYAEEPRHSEMVRVSFILAKLNKEGYSLENISKKNWYHDRVMKYNHFYSPPKFQYKGNTATLLPHHMLWPIPQDVITANTMARINQNIGYDGAELNKPILETIPE